MEAIEMAMEPEKGTMSQRVWVVVPPVPGPSKSYGILETTEQAEQDEHVGDMDRVVFGDGLGWSGKERAIAYAARLNGEIAEDTQRKRNPRPKRAQVATPAPRVRRDRRKAYTKVVELHGASVTLSIINPKFTDLMAYPNECNWLLAIVDLFKHGPIGSTVPKGEEKQ